MPMFKIRLTRLIEQECSIYVRAATIDEANDIITKLDWERCDNSGYDQDGNAPGEECDIPPKRQDKE